MCGDHIWDHATKSTVGPPRPNEPMAIWKISLIHSLLHRCGGVPNGNVLRRICMMRPQAKLTKLKKHLLHRRSIYLYFSIPGNIIVVDLHVAKKVTRAQTTKVLGMRKILMATRWSKMLETLDNVPLHTHNKDPTLSSPRVNPAWTIGLQTCIVLLTYLCCFAGRSRDGACRDKTKMTLIAALARTVWSL